MGMIRILRIHMYIYRLYTKFISISLKKDQTSGKTGEYSCPVSLKKEEM